MTLKTLPAVLEDNLYTAQQIRQLDAIAINQHGIPGITLMRRAAKACVEVIFAQWPTLASCAVYCGSGNNAGDGCIVAALLANRGIDVRLYMLGNIDKLSADARAAYHHALQSNARVTPFASTDPQTETELIVDALLGIGLSGAIRPLYQSAINLINRSPRPVLAVDIPSGLSADSGAQLGEAIRADHTVTFVGLKQGMFTLDGPDCVGQLHFDNLGIAADMPADWTPSCRKLCLGAVQGALLPRPKHSHKNNFGHLLVIGGDEGMGGAAAMAALAAMRSGAGLVSLATHPAHRHTILAAHPEIMVHGLASPQQLAPLLAKASALVLGPGLGLSSWSEKIFETTLQRRLPMVLDADGLNILAGTELQRDNWILTPHPGEAARMLKGAANTLDRFAAVRWLQQQYGGVVLLKGVGSLIADSTRTALCPFGNPGMSTAGMGDILSGLIGALLAQGLSLMDATELGAVVHSIAADKCAKIAGARGLMATDLLPDIRRLLNPALL